MTNQRPPVAILGASGFIGGNLAALLTRRGFGVSGFGSADCNLCDPVAVGTLTANLAPDTRVVVCATVNRTVDDSYFALTQNLAMAENLVVAMPKGRLGGLIFMSTVDVYGRAPVLPVTEATRFEPANYYGIGKLASEQILRRPDALDCPVTILRCAGVYGPGDRQISIVGAFLARIVERKTITLYGDGSVLRDYFEFQDVCEVVAHFVESPKDGFFNVVSGKSLQLREWIDVLGRVSDRVVAVERRGMGTSSAGDLVFDNAALRRELGGGIGFTEPEEGARRYLAHLMERKRA